MAENQELRSELVLDTAQLTARIREIEQRDALVDKKLEKTEHRLGEAEQHHSRLDRLIHRTEHKFQHAFKTLFKIGAGTLAADLIASSEDAGGSPNFAAGFLGSAATGAVFGGGLPGAATAAAFYLIRKAEHQVAEIFEEMKKLREEMEETRKKNREFNKALRDALEKDAERQRQELAEIPVDVGVKHAGDLRELMYQAARAKVEAE